jgi:hypothetical protein
MTAPAYHTKCQHCQGQLTTLGLATLTPTGHWTAVFCPRCDRRPCAACGHQVVDGGAHTCPNKACGAVL